MVMFCLDKLPENGLFIHPRGGLANRLLAISSALALGRKLGKPVYTIWELDSYSYGFNEYFSSLFEVVGNTLNFLYDARQIPFYYKPRRKKLRLEYYVAKFILDNFFFDCTLSIVRYSKALEEGLAPMTQKRVEELTRYNRIYIISCLLFYPSELLNLSYLRPVRSIRESIDKTLEKFGDYCVGIHIRRTDNYKSCKYSITETFVRFMKSEVDRNSNVKFFVASDSEAEKENMIRIFGKRVITCEAELSRNTPQSMRDAVVEVYLLGGTNKIFGSMGSTYSCQAFYLRGVPLYMVCNDDLVLYEPTNHPNTIIYNKI